MILPIPFRQLLLTLMVLPTLAKAAIELLPTDPQLQRASSPVVMPGGKTHRFWETAEGAGTLVFRSESKDVVPTDGALYVRISYLDKGYGKIHVSLERKEGEIRPDRYLGLTRMDTGNMVDAFLRLPSISSVDYAQVALRIRLEQPKEETLRIAGVVLQETPFNDPQFKFVISDPWLGPYQGPSVKPPENSTLVGKAMTGYQGWFRTPNDPYGMGWNHWGNVTDGTFSVDMWPDISEYPPHTVEKAGAVKLMSGKQAALFSSAWPEVADTHFRWMREHDIDGVFLQRFVSDSFHSISGKPEWVLANVRAAANKEGRIWAIEYDVSGYPNDRLLETLKKDWKWLVDDFKLLQDANYAREGDKPVVFIWGMPFPDRGISPGTADAVVDFFRNDPEYGGNYVIGGIPGNWRNMQPEWQQHIENYHCVLSWMSEKFAEDITDFGKFGIPYYSHVRPGFSWANLKHLPTGDTTMQYTAREGGRYYWNQLAKSAEAGGKRLFVGMFDEYDEATAVMPSSDDAPHTPARAGVAATFFNGANAAEHGEFKLLPSTRVELGTEAPIGKVSAENFYLRMGGVITFPEAGEYSFLVEGASGDDTELFLAGKKVISAQGIPNVSAPSSSVSVKAGQKMAFRLEYRHRTEKGTLCLLWNRPGQDSPQSIPPQFLQDAWGRFITNEGMPADWWLQLTRMGKTMMLEGRAKEFPGSKH